MAPKKKLFLKLEKKFPPKMWPLSSQGEGCKALVAGPLKKVFKKNLIVLGGGSAPSSIAKCIKKYFIQGV